MPQYLTGVTTPLQLIVMALIQIAIYACNEYIVIEILQVLFLFWILFWYHASIMQLNWITFWSKVSDIGTSLLVHVYGAYFGLTVSFVLRRDVLSEKEGSSYNSNISAMIGTRSFTFRTILKYQLWFYRTL